MRGFDGSVRSNGVELVSVYTPVSARSEAIQVPGAITVGPGWLSGPPPMLEYEVSSWPSLVAPPTLTTHGAIEYALIDPDVGPPPVSLGVPAGPCGPPESPVASTTTMPASCAALVAMLMGSLGSKAIVESPHDPLTTRMLYFAWFSRIQSKPAVVAIMSVAWPAPTPMRCAPGATPV